MSPATDSLDPVSEVVFCSGVFRFIAIRLELRVAGQRVEPFDDFSAIPAKQALDRPFRVHAHRPLARRTNVQNFGLPVFRLLAALNFGVRDRLAEIAPIAALPPSLDKSMILNQAFEAIS